MRRRLTRSVLLPLAACGGLVLAAIAPRASGAAPPQSTPPAIGAIPGIDPGYIYGQFDHLVTHFQHREAGYRAGGAGHEGFARYWSGQMLHLLGPFGAR